MSYLLQKEKSKKRKKTTVTDEGRETMPDNFPRVDIHSVAKSQDPRWIITQEVPPDVKDPLLASALVAAELGVLNPMGDPEKCSKVLHEGFAKWQEGLKLQKEGIEMISKVALMTDAQEFCLSMQNMISNSSVFQSKIAPMAKPKEKLQNVAMIGDQVINPSKMFTEAGQVRYKCPLCSLIASYGSVKTHIQKDHKKEKFICEFCKDYLTYSYETLQKHRKMCKRNVEKAPKKRRITLSKKTEQEEKKQAFKGKGDDNVVPFGFTE